MGSDKALLTLAGEPVIARLADELAKLAESTVIACGPGSAGSTTSCSFPRLRTIIKAAALWPVFMRRSAIHRRNGIW